MEAILKSLHAPAGCKTKCKKWRDKMNLWGVEGCKANRAAIIGRLKSAAFKSWVTDQIRVGWAMSKEPWFRFDDPLGSLVDEAIRRAATAEGANQK